MEGMTGSGTPSRTGAGALRWTLMVLTLMAALVAGLALSQQPASAQDQGETQSYAGDTIAPKVENVAFSHGTGPYRAGQVVSVRVLFSEDIYSNGPSHLFIKVGDTERKAANPGRPKKEAVRALVYSYRIQEGESDTDGVSVPPGRIVLEGCTAIRDEDNIEGSYGSQGNHAMLHYDGLNHDSEHTVDAVPPKVSSVSVADAPGGGTYGAGDEIVVTVTFSEPVEVTGGNPSLTVMVGTQSRAATFKSQSDDKRSMTFAYKVQSGDAAPNGVSVNADSISLPTGASVADGAGNTATLSHQAVAANSKAVVEAAPPAVSGLSVTTTGPYGIGDDIGFELGFNKAIAVSGTPTLSFRAGTDTKQAAYARAEGSNVHFTYRVAEGDSAPSGLSVDADSVSLPDGATVRSSGVDAALAHAAVTASADQAIDGVRPTVTGLQMQGEPKAYSTGDSITVAATFSENVSVAGAPTLTLQVGDQARTAAYTGHDGAAVSFAYTVQSNDADENGVSVNAGSIAIPEGGHIRDAAGNDATLSHPSMADQSGHKIAGPPASITSITPEDGGTRKEPGDSIVWQVQFNEPVQVSGKPELDMDVGGKEIAAVYRKKTADTLEFRYQVQSGDNDGDGVSVPAGSIRLPSGAGITDADGSSVNLSHSGATGGPTVDGGAPQIVSIGINGPPLTYGEGGKIVFEVRFNEKVIVAKHPTLKVQIGDQLQVARYERRQGEPQGYPENPMRFAYTVQDGDDDSDGISVPSGDIALPYYGTTIKDEAGNAAGLSHDGAQLDGYLVRDDSPPSIVEMRFVGPNQEHFKLPPLGEGGLLAVAVRFSSKVKTKGKPTLTVMIGEREVEFKHGLFPGGLWFRYKVQAGDEDTDGISIPAGSINTDEKNQVTGLGGGGAVVTHSGLEDNPGYKVDATN